MYKVGNSIDIHKLVSGDHLNIGGVKIPCEYSSLAYSDGDACLHAVCEALLGALGKGDLGDNYPNTNERFKGISSTYFINDVKDMLAKENFEISNIDIMIVLEKPKITTYKKKIKENIASLLEIDPSLVNIKAGTNEKIGSIGDSKSYLVWASCIIEQSSDII